MSTKSKVKKEKNKIAKLIDKCDSDKEESDHELSYYVNDRVKLMKEVLKIIKPKKIKTMAPDCIKNLDNEEINSMLLEELLGISNKRLKYIFNGQNPSEDSSSTDPEEEKPPIDIISLDDVSDDDFVVEVDAAKSKKSKNLRKEEMKIKRIKQEKRDKSKRLKNMKEPLQEENLMSVLELLELQARARAIRSQLMLETNKSTQQEKNIKENEDSDTDEDDAVIIELPKHDEIVITSSDSENEQNSQKNGQETENVTTEQTEGDSSKNKKIKLIRNRTDTSSEIIETPSEETQESGKRDNVENTHPEEVEKINEKSTTEETKEKEEHKNTESSHDDDEIILIVDQEEIDGIMGE